MNIDFPSETEEEAAEGETKPKSQNWMEQAEKRLELLKLEVEKENADESDDEDDWFGSDDDLDDDISDDDSSS